MLAPVTGRFYPRNFLRDLPEFYAEDRRPFRCLASANETLTADFNHPFAGFPATLHAQLLDVLEEKQERGGRCNDLAGGIIDNGPGMQAALENGDVDFLASENPSRAWIHVLTCSFTGSHGWFSISIEPRWPT